MSLVFPFCGQCCGPLLRGDRQFFSAVRLIPPFAAMRSLVALRAASRASPLGIPATAWRAGALRLHRTHADPYVRGEFTPRREWANRDWTERAFTIGIGGPVGSGKTALVLQLCRRLRERLSIAVVTNDIFTKEVRPRALSHPGPVCALRPVASRGRTPNSSRSTVRSPRSASPPSRLAVVHMLPFARTSRPISPRWSSSRCGWRPTSSCASLVEIISQRTSRRSWPTTPCT